MNSEIGRELKAHELKPSTVVVSQAEHRPDVFITLWVIAVGEAGAVLYAGDSNPPMHLLLSRQSDGTFKDAGGRTIRMYEYLGEV